MSWVVSLNAHVNRVATPPRHVMQTHTRRRTRVPRGARVFAEPVRGRRPSSASQSRQHPPLGNGCRSIARRARHSQGPMTLVRPPNGCVVLEPTRCHSVSPPTRRRSSSSRARLRRRDPRDRTRRYVQFQNEADPPKRAAAWTYQRRVHRRWPSPLPQRRRDQSSEARRPSRCNPLHRQRTAC